MMFRASTIRRAAVLFVALALMPTHFARSAVPAKADGAYLSAWYDVFGERCGKDKGPGCHYFQAGKDLAGLSEAEDSGELATAEREATEKTPLAVQKKRETILQAGKQYARKRGLPQHVGIHIATTLHDWAELGTTRERTQKELQDYTERLYGLSPDQARAALPDIRSGNLSNLERHAGEIAGFWQTTPANARKVIRSLAAAELEAGGK
jgi:hypothetical protein